VWETPDLISSFDGASALLAADENFSPPQVGLHVDANWHMGEEQRGMKAVQSMLLLTDQSAATGGLVVLPRSHELHEKLQQGGIINGASWLYPIDGFASELLNTSRLLIKARAGDLVLWDSRLVHAVVPPIDEPAAAAAAAIDAAGTSGRVLRLAAYVCMTPRQFAAEGWLRTRWMAFHQKVATGHWPHLPNLVGSLNTLPEQQLKDQSPDTAGFEDKLSCDHVPLDVCQLIGLPDPQ